MAVGPYQSQMSATGGGNLSGASPEAFGAGAARGLEEAGASLDRTIHTIKERDRDNQAASAGVELSQVSADIDNAAIDARANAAPGGEGHGAAIVTALDDRARDALGRIKDSHIRAAFTARYADLRERIGTREHAWEAGARVDKFVNDFDSQGTVAANAQLSNPDPTTFAASLHDVEATGALLAVPADTKAKAVKEQQRKIAAAWGNAMQEKDPHSLIATLDKGALNQYLEPEDIKSLRSGGMVEIRRLEAAKERDLNQAKADARERTNLIGTRIAAGDFSVSDGEFKSAFEDAKKYGFEDLAFKLSDWKDKRDVVRETRDYTPVQWHDAINQLAAKGDKASAAESVRLKHLRELAPEAIGRFNNDPHGFAANSGNPAPPIDWDKPTAPQIQARISWARSTQQATGAQAAPYLSTDEIKVFHDRVATGPVGQLEVATQLRGLMGVGVGTEIAKQIDPNDKDLQLMVGLPPRTAEWYKKGVDALKRNPKLFAGGEGDADRTREIFAEYAPGIPQELRTPVFNAARAIAAGAADEWGKSSLEGPEFEQIFRDTIQRAGGQVGGGNGKTGGFVNWNGRRAWLPQSMGQSEFQQRISRAGPGAWKQAAGGLPHYMAGNGKLTPLSDDQLKQLGRYTLETVAPGVYQPIGPDGGHLVDDKGRPWQFDVRKLPGGSKFDDQLAAVGYSRH